MWFYILLIVVVALFVWWLTRTNLFRHWRRHAADHGGRSASTATSQMYGGSSSVAKDAGDNDVP